MELLWKVFPLANLLFYRIFLAFVTIFAAQLIDDNTVKTACTKYANSTCNESQHVTNQEVLV